MKKILFIILVLLTNAIYAQVGIGTISPQGALDINSTTQGFVLPRVALTSKVSQMPIDNPNGINIVAGTIVFNTATVQTGTSNELRPGLHYWNSSAWVPVYASDNADYFGVPRIANFKLNSDILDFLNGYGAGSRESLPMVEVANFIMYNGVVFNSTSNSLRFQPGIYKIEFTYEGAHNNGTCDLSSYFIDFPFGSNPYATRIHSNAAHNPGGNSNHGNTISYITKITNALNWEIHLGRGAAGNCSATGNLIRANSTFLTVSRISSL